MSVINYGIAGAYTPPPWVPNTEPETEQVAEWYRSMTHDQLVAALQVQRRVWTEESRCFERDHDGQLADYSRQMDTVHADLRAIMAALGISDHARPYSSHEVIHREVIPAIRRLSDA